MALFKIHKGLKANLPTTYNAGYCYFTTDDGKFYIDTTNTAAGRIILNAGQADKLGSATLGSTTKPVYLNQGVATACSTYAGGTKVTLNGSSKGGSTASFYAPTAVGTAGQYLQSNGSGAPTWAEISTVGLTHIGNSQPTNTDYVLWVDTDEPDAVIGYEIYTGPSQPTEESYDLWIDTSKEASVSLPASETMRKDAIKYKTFSIATSAWSGSGPYTYQMTANGITANTAILNLTLDATSQTYQKAQLDWETGANFIKLSTATKPTGTISGYLIATEVTVI